MTIVRGHFDGKRVVLDEPVPSKIVPNTPVNVVFDDGKSVLGQIADLAVPGGLPTDYAEQHEHYVKGATRR